MNDPKKLSIAVYALYLAAFLVPFALLIGLALAFFKRDVLSGSIWGSHFDNALFTAAAVVGAMVAGWILAFVFLGWLAWLAGALFLAFRAITGLMAAFDERRYDQWTPKLL